MLNLVYFSSFKTKYLYIMLDLCLANLHSPHNLCASRGSLYFRWTHMSIYLSPLDLISLIE